MTSSTKTRCAWADANELLAVYHDEQWGIPVHDDHLLLEMLNLEGAQAGLSWLTILKKRPAYRMAFDNFDASKIARYDQAKRKELMANAGIVRNRLKVNAFIENAKAFLSAQKEFGSFNEYIWQFITTVPNPTEVSSQMSKDLKKRGFKFVGPTICYAFMQATGMVNDHDKTCFRS